MPSRIILLSDHNSHGQRLAQTFIERGIALDAVVVPGGSALWKQGAKTWARSVEDAVRRRARFHRRQREFYKPLTRRVIAAGELNSAAMQRLLTRLAPDYIVVGLGRILKPPIIETARCGVFNVHPGLLPWVRGSGVVGHSLGAGVPVGVTLHFIDPGIDTGAIIERRLLPITSKSQRLPDLEVAVGQLAARMMADAVESLLRGGQKPAATPQTARFPLFRAPDAQERQALNRLALAGRAPELFESWKEFSLGAPDWVLPPNWMDAPLAPQS